MQETRQNTWNSLRGYYKLLQSIYEPGEETVDQKIVEGEMQAQQSYDSPLTIHPPAPAEADPHRTRASLQGICDKLLFEQEILRGVISEKDRLIEAQSEVIEQQVQSWIDIAASVVAKENVGEGRARP